MFCVLSTLPSNYSWYSNHLLVSMNKISVYKNPHLICNRLILSKVSCFSVKSFWWGFFKAVYLLSHSCLAGNVDDLLDDVTGLVGICLVPEWDDSSDVVFNESYEDIEEEKSDEISIVVCSIRTRSCYLIASLWRNVSSNSSLASFIICIISENFECLFLLGWNWQARIRYDFFISSSVEDSFKPRTR